MTPINIAYIISSVNKSLAFEWIANHIDTSKFKLTFILLNNKHTPLEEFLSKKNIPTFRVNYNKKKDLPFAILNTIKLLKQNKIEIVHCHLFEACLVGLTAAKFAGIKKRIHTRHNATIHHQYHPKAVKFDKYINFMSSDIVAISQNVKNILVDMEHVDPKKIIIVHHGFDFIDFENISQERIDTVIKKYFIDSKLSHPTIGVISRYIHWKGVQYIIPAFKSMLNTYPNAHLILANAEGPYTLEIKALLKELPKHSFTEILFEEDIFALYKLFDIFIHTPIDEKSEAFGQVYIETMASEIPSIVTMSGIAPEYIKNNENAVVVPFKNSIAIADSLDEILKNKSLKENIITEGKKSVLKLFNIHTMIQRLEELYDK